MSVIVYEPSLKADEFNGVEVVRGLAEFTRRADVIIANRHADESWPMASIRLHARDIYQRDDARWRGDRLPAELSLRS